MCSVDTLKEHLVSKTKIYTNPKTALNPVRQLRDNVQNDVNFANGKMDAAVQEKAWQKQYGKPKQQATLLTGASSSATGYGQSYASQTLLGKS